MKRLAFIFLACALILASTTAYPQDRSNVEQVSRMFNFWDGAYEIVVRGDLAYIAAGSAGLQILDISDPENIEIVGFWDGNPGLATGVFIRDNYAFLACSGLIIIDIENPAQPFQSGAVDTKDFTYGAVHAERDYVLLGAGEIMYIIDISNMHSPEIIADYDFRWNWIRDINVKDHVAYVCTYSNGLFSLDISDAYNPVYLDGYGSDALKIVIYNDLAILTHGNFADGISIVDISNPDELTEVSYINGRFRSSDVSDNFLFAVEHDLKAYNIRNPERPNLIAELEDSISVGAANDMDCENDKCYVISGDRYRQPYNFMSVVDVSDPWEPTREATWENSGICRDAKLSGNYLVSANDASGVVISNVSDIHNPQSVSVYNPGAKALCAHTDGDRAFIGTERGFEIIDLRNPRQPELIRAYHRSSTYSIAIKDSLIFASRDIYFIDDEDNIFFLNNFGGGLDLHISGDYLYAAGNLGLRIIDISDPENPEEIGFFDTQGTASGVHVERHFAFVADGEEGLSVIDVIRPERPMEAGYLDTDGTAEAIDVEGDYAFIADGGAGLKVIDISDVQNPRLCGYYNTPGYAQEICVRNGIAYVSDKTNIGIYDCSEGLRVNNNAEKGLSGYGIIHAYPNPFNSSTTIEFNAARPGFVSFQLYDSAGRALNSFSREQWVGEGGNRFRLDGGSLAAGEYFVLMRLNGKSQIRKITFEK